MLGQSGHVICKRIIGSEILILSIVRKRSFSSRVCKMPLWVDAGSFLRSIAGAWLA